MENRDSENHRQFFEQLDQQMKEFIKRRREAHELYQDAQTFLRPLSVKRQRQFEIAQRIVDYCDGSKSLAARRLGISRNTLRYWLGEN